MRKPRDAGPTWRLASWLRRLWSPALAAADAARDGGRSAEAARLYGEVLAAHPERTDLRVQRANMLKDCNRFEEAEEEYLIAAVERPNDADVYLQTGHLYRMMGDRNRAIHHYRVAGSLSSALTDAGDALRDLGDPSVLDAQFRARSRCSRLRRK
jgi:tetratricopeptide (TPR) repeat protein